MDRKGIVMLGGVLLSLALVPLHLQAAAGSTPASTESVAAPTIDSYWPRVIEVLADDGHSRERALAAQLGVVHAHLLNRIADNATASSIDPAGAAAIHLLLPELAGSEDPLALSLALQAGISAADTAVVEAAARRWQALEPDNLAPILWTRQSPEKMLEAARTTRRYDSHAYEQIRFMMGVFQRVPMTRQEAGEGYRELDDTDEARAALNAFALWAAYGIPAFQEVTVACRDPALHAAAGRAADCRHVADVLASTADVLVAQGIGIGMLKRTATSAEEQAQAQALRRDLDWQTHQRYASDANGQTLREDVATMLRLLRDPGIGSERQMNEAMLRERGVALIPPDDWQAPNTN